MSIQLRMARESDADRLCEIQIDAIQQLGLSCYTSKQLEPWWSGLTPAHHIRYIRDYYSVVAEDNEILVGYGMLSGQESEIAAVYVVPPYARQGVGSKLLAKLLDEARRIGLSSLTCHASLNAVPFYEDTGFTIVRELVHTFSQGGSIKCAEMKLQMGNSR